MTSWVIVICPLNIAFSYKWEANPYRREREREERGTGLTSHLRPSHHLPFLPSSPSSSLSMPCTGYCPWAPIHFSSLSLSFVLLLSPLVLISSHRLINPSDGLISPSLSPSSCISHCPSWIECQWWEWVIGLGRQKSSMKSSSNSMSVSANLFMNKNLPMHHHWFKVWFPLWKLIWPYNHECFFQ